ncbi:hypothetical protein Ntsu_71950 [Nocardia sp. IFM 10818]
MRPVPPHADHSTFPRVPTPRDLKHHRPGWTLVENRPAPLVLGPVSTLITIGTFVLFLVWQEDSPENRR